MRKFFAFIFLLGISCSVMSQAVGIGTNNPHSSSIVEISSNNKGLLLPRVIDTSSITNPARGLTIFSTTNNKVWMYNGQRWQQLATNAGGSDSAWFVRNDSIIYTGHKYVGIGTDPAFFAPRLAMEINGGLLVKEPQKVTKAAPTTAQTYTMQNSVDLSRFGANDSVLRLFDAGGLGNYNNNTSGNVLVPFQEKGGQEGWKVKFNSSDFGLAIGDTLWVSQKPYPQCIEENIRMFTLDDVEVPEFFIGEGDLLFLFRSDNVEVARGFDITITRLYTDGRIRKSLASSGGAGLYFSKGAFAAGYGANVAGLRAIAIGGNSNANATFSMVLGFENVATNYSSNAVAIGTGNRVSSAYSFAFGRLNTVTYTEGVAIGRGNISSGLSSITLGNNLTSKSFGGVTVGLYNDNSDTPNSGPLDRIFQVGNGSSSLRRNALTILRNGNIGIGVLQPNAQLQFPNTLGNRKLVLWENINDNLEYFGFGINDYAMRYNVTSGSSHIFYCTSTPVFTINNVGDALLRGTLTQNSDARLKTNITRYEGALLNLQKLNGYRYQWKEADRPKGQQLGLLAQEVKNIFPELVQEDRNGVMSVNYIGLVPVLVESIKELTQKIEQQQKQIDALLKRAK